jgi:competence protein CoiA
MQLALVNNKKVEAFQAGRGVCPRCGSETIAKCGSRVVHHWAHYKMRDCDPWRENETPWHREWKNHFPIECREVSHTANDGEIHRADIKTPTGIVIEVQHSAMTDAERISREEFYENLVWVLDGSVFKKNFDIYHMLPNPQSELARDLIWFKAKRHKNGANGGLFFRRSDTRQGLIHGIDEISEEIKSVYIGHHQFDWIRPRRTWLDSNSPVYIDFGDGYLVKLETYDKNDLKCVRLVSKCNFINDAMNENKAENIASPLHSIINR